jgi:cobalamin biosynthesis Co2+ chelatase CbiK
MYVEIGRQLTAEETVALGKAIDNPDIGLINGPDGIFIVNFSTMDNKTFIQNIENTVEKNLDADITIKYAQSDGNLLIIGNNGQDYIKKISDQGRLDILETVASLLKRKKQFDEQFAKQHGYTFDGTAYDNIIGQIESTLKQQEGLTTNIPSNQGGI